MLNTDSKFQSIFLKESTEFCSIIKVIDTLLPRILVRLLSDMHDVNIYLSALDNFFLICNRRLKLTKNAAWMRQMTDVSYNDMFDLIHKPDLLKLCDCFGFYCGKLLFHLLSTPYGTLSLLTSQCILLIERISSPKSKHVLYQFLLSNPDNYEIFQRHNENPPQIQAINQLIDLATPFITDFSFFLPALKLIVAYSPALLPNFHLVSFPNSPLPEQDWDFVHNTLKIPSLYPLLLHRNSKVPEMKTLRLIFNLLENNKKDLPSFWLGPQVPLEIAIIRLLREKNENKKNSTKKINGFDLLCCLMRILSSSNTSYFDYLLSFYKGNQIRRETLEDQFSASLVTVKAPPPFFLLSHQILSPFAPCAYFCNVSKNFHFSQKLGVLPMKRQYKKEFVTQARLNIDCFKPSTEDSFLPPSFEIITAHDSHLNTTESNAFEYLGSLSNVFFDESQHTSCVSSDDKLDLEQEEMQRKKCQTSIIIARKKARMTEWNNKLQYAGKNTTHLKLGCSENAFNSLSCETGLKRNSVFDEIENKLDSLSGNDKYIESPISGKRQKKHRNDEEISNVESDKENDQSMAKTQSSPDNIPCTKFKPFHENKGPSIMSAYDPLEYHPQGSIHYVSAMEKQNSFTITRRATEIPLPLVPTTSNQNLVPQNIRIINTITIKYLFEVMNLTFMFNNSCHALNNDTTSKNEIFIDLCRPLPSFIPFLLPPVYSNEVSQKTEIVSSQALSRRIRLLSSATSRTEIPQIKDIFKLVKTALAEKGKKSEDDEFEIYPDLKLMREKLIPGLLKFPETNFYEACENKKIKNYEMHEMLLDVAGMGKECISSQFIVSLRFLLELLYAKNEFIIQSILNAVNDHISLDIQGNTAIKAVMQPELYFGEYLESKNKQGMQSDVEWQRFSFHPFFRSLNGKQILSDIKKRDEGLNLTKEKLINIKSLYFRKDNVKMNTFSLCDFELFLKALEKIIGMQILFGCGLDNFLDGWRSIFIENKEHGLDLSISNFLT